MNNKQGEWVFGGFCGLEKGRCGVYWVVVEAMKKVSAHGGGKFFFVGTLEIGVRGSIWGSCFF